MRFRNLFKSKWRRTDSTTVAKTKSARKLRKMADQNDDERIRLEAARRLNDVTVLKALAQAATQETVRMDAAILVNDQPCLTAIALKAWNIHLGQEAVAHIRNQMLLRRVARSAQQDAIRLAAALKLQDADLLRQVAQSSNHVDVHWQVAQYLNDPCMLADIVLFKPGNLRLEPLRRMARQALMDQLDHCEKKKDQVALLTSIRSLSNPCFKIEAFVRLPTDYIDAPLLEYIAAQDLRYIPRKLLEIMIMRIQAAKWQVALSIQHSDCIFCRGTGQLSLKCISANDTWSDYDAFVCPECRGFGKIPFRQALCARPDGTRIKLKLPV